MGLLFPEVKVIHLFEEMSFGDKCMISHIEREQLENR